MANVRIPQLPPAIGLSGTEEVEIARPTGNPVVPYVSERTTTGAIAIGAQPSNFPVVLATPSAFAPLGRVLTGTANDISVTDNGAGSTIVLDLVSTAAVPGTYGSSTQVAQITVDQKGRITGVTNVNVAAGAGTVTHTGALDVQHIVLGNAAADIKVVAGLLSDGVSQLLLGVAGGAAGGVVFSNATSGSISLLPVTGALGSVTLRLPAATDTLIGKATTDTLTNKTFDTAGAGNSFSINGLAATANTGTGAVVRATAPSITSLANLTTNGLVTTSGGVGTLGVTVPGTGILTWLATPSSANLAAAMTDETGTGALVFANTPTLVTPNIGAATGSSLNIGAGVLTTGTIEIGNTTDTTISRLSAGVIAVEGLPLYSNIPPNSKSANYTTVLSDAQEFILHPTADNNARTFTIDSNANVPYPIGTAITFVNQINTVTIAITADTMVLAGLGTTGSRTLAASGIATALKIATTTWIISGVGLT